LSLFYPYKNNILTTTITLFVNPYADMKDIVQNNPTAYKSLLKKSRKVMVAMSNERLLYQIDTKKE